MVNLQSPVRRKFERGNPAGPPPVHHGFVPTPRTMLTTSSGKTLLVSAISCFSIHFLLTMALFENAQGRSISNLHELHSRYFEVDSIPEKHKCLQRSSEEEDSTCSSKYCIFTLWAQHASASCNTNATQPVAAQNNTSPTTECRQTNVML